MKCFGTLSDFFLVNPGDFCPVLDINCTLVSLSKPFLPYFHIFLQAAASLHTTLTTVRAVETEDRCKALQLIQG